MEQWPWTPATSLWMHCCKEICHARKGYLNKCLISHDRPQELCIFFFSFGRGGHNHNNTGQRQEHGERFTFFFKARIFLSTSPVRLAALEPSIECDEVLPSTVVVERTSWLIWEETESNDSDFIFDSWPYSVSSSSATVASEVLALSSAACEYNLSTFLKRGNGGEDRSLLRLFCQMKIGLIPGRNKLLSEDTLSTVYQTITPKLPLSIANNMNHT